MAIGRAYLGFTGFTFPRVLSSSSRGYSSRWLSSGCQERVKGEREVRAALSTVEASRDPLLASEEKTQQHPEGDGHRCLHHLGSDFERHHAEPPPGSAPRPSRELHGIRGADRGPDSARAPQGRAILLWYIGLRGLRLRHPSPRSTVSCPGGHAQRRVRCPARHSSPPRPQGRDQSTTIDSKYALFTSSGTVLCPHSKLRHRGQSFSPNDMTRAAMERT